jgi:hypothetical protein
MHLNPHSAIELPTNEQHVAATWRSKANVLVEEANTAVAMNGGQTCLLQQM